MSKKSARKRGHGRNEQPTMPKGNMTPQAQAGASRPPQALAAVHALYTQGRFDDALKRARMLVERHPQVPFLHNIIGAILARQGDYPGAADSYRQAIALKPDMSDAHNNLGNALRELEKYDEAIDSYQEAIRLQPDFVAAHNNLGKVLSKTGRHEDAVVSFLRATSFDAEFYEGFLNLGNSMRALNRSKEAIQFYQRAVALKPDSVAAYINLAGACSQNESPEDAVRYLRKAIALNPDAAEAYFGLGNNLKKLGKIDDARKSYQKAITISPEHANCHNMLGNLHVEEGNFSAALKAYSTAVDLAPRSINPVKNLGWLQTVLGDSEAARAALQKAIELNPQETDAYRQIAMLKKVREGDALIAELDRLEEEISEGPQRIHLCFAQGKVNEDLGNIDRAFNFYAEGNRLRKAELGYHIDYDRQLFDRIKAAFAGDNEPLSTPFETGASQPILIVGMPRSGTSLVEQILSAHGRVHGAGELEALSLAVDSQFIKPTEDSDVDLNPTSRAIFRDYGHRLRAIETDAPFLTDKMPNNFRWVGFLLQANPDIKVINLVRDPRAVCWSIYKRYFPASGLGFACDLQDLGLYFQLYRDLMTFWDERFPGRIYHLDYEQLTIDQETETRNLLDYCGLPWEDACLDFHLQKRAVATASATQVREKMYQGSSEEWRKFERHLEPLLSQLPENP